MASPKWLGRPTIHLTSEVFRPFFVLADADAGGLVGVDAGPLVAGRAWVAAPVWMPYDRDQAPEGWPLGLESALRPGEPNTREDSPMIGVARKLLSLALALAFSLSLALVVVSRGVGYATEGGDGAQPIALLSREAPGADDDRDEDDDDDTLGTDNDGFDTPSTDYDGVDTPETDDDGIDTPYTDYDGFNTPPTDGDGDRHPDPDG